MQLGEVPHWLGVRGIAIDASAHATLDQRRADPVIEPHAGPYRDVGAVALHHADHQQHDANDDGEHQQCLDAAGRQHAVIDLQHVDGRRQHQQIDGQAEQRHHGERGAALAQSQLQLGWIVALIDDRLAHAGVGSPRCPLNKEVGVDCEVGVDDRQCCSEARAVEEHGHVEGRSIEDECGLATDGALNDLGRGRSEDDVLCQRCVAAERVVADDPNARGVAGNDVGIGAVSRTAGGLAADAVAEQLLGSRAFDHEDICAIAAAQGVVAGTRADRVGELVAGERVVECRAGQVLDRVRDDIAGRISVGHAVERCSLLRGTARGRAARKRHGDAC